MRSGKEVRRAVAILGRSLLGEERRFVWEAYPLEAERALAMLETLAWVVGADESDFNLTLEYAQLKLTKYVEQQNEEGKYAN